MTTKEHIIICSHGFGVRKDDGGLFTDISTEFSDRDTKTIMFDYNEINEIDNQIRVKSFSEQTKILQNVIERTKKEHPHAIIDIIAHSQGAVMVALANLEGIRQVVLLAPFFHTDKERALARYAKRAGRSVDPATTSTIKRTDGSSTVIPPAYWSERFASDIALIYTTLASTTKTTIICAREDQVYDQRDAPTIPGAHRTTIPGDHDFRGESRTILVQQLKEILK